jgi:transcriptional regulator with XRE-family HTH domain
MFIENLLYLQWKERVERQLWTQRLAQQLAVSSARIHDLINGTAPTATELANASVSTEITEEDLLYRRLVADENIFRENICFLLDTLHHGGQKQLAKTLNVRAEALSTWRNGTKPRGKTVTQIRQFFGLPDRFDLENSSVFLSIEPVSVFEKRNWLKRRLEEIDHTNLVELFPALQRMLH